ncbi:MAG: glucose-6-phosphate isomerase [Planctomycetes bacterium]|nr:glucose-6-phosphate isomerase [Planctomycetota bacterium]
MDIRLPEEGTIRVLGGRITFRFGNMLAGRNPRGIGLEELEAQRAKITRAGRALAKLRKRGLYDRHTRKDGSLEPVQFAWLPRLDRGINTEASIREILAWRDERAGADEVIAFGIGGSYLGNRVLFDVFCGEAWNERPRPPRAFPRFHFLGHNLNPLRLRRILDAVLDRRSRRVECIVISKYGSTAETFGEFFAIRDILRAAGVEVGVTAVTGTVGGLRGLATRERWPIFEFPEGAGGRWSVFSNAGLVTGAMNGVDIDAFLRGARDMDDATRADDLAANPAYLEASLLHVASKKHKLTIGVCMPYLDELHSLAKWKVQLQAESLGKRWNLRRTKEVHAGRTPLVAIGTEDMHAQTQQHIEGRFDKTIAMIGVERFDAEDVTLPAGLPEVEGLPDLGGLRLGQVLAFAREANEESLTAAGRLNMTILLDRLDAYTLGALMYFWMVSTAFEGTLEGIDPFDQPGVEHYKRILRAKIAAAKAAPG